jgi:nuclease S1
MRIGMPRRNATFLRCAALVLAVVLSRSSVRAWGPQGHRLVALVAMNHLSPTARQNIAWLLGSQTLPDIAVSADRYLEGNNQTSFWHYVNIPAEAKSYDRDRDCPRQPAVGAGARGDRWRDCAVDRIAYNRERLADTSLDRADRTIALKFLVHLIGDLHQPFHALGVERGGNGILVSVFGSPTCTHDDGASYRCNLHGVWDTVLVARRRLSDREYLAELERDIANHRWDDVVRRSAVEWAMESHDLANAAMMRPQENVDEAYYRTHSRTVDTRLALGGLRLAAVLDESLSQPPPR